MIIPEKWTEIAYEASGEWIPLFGAPLTLAEAKYLHEQGVLLMAQRRRTSGHKVGQIPPMEIVVKKANPEREKKSQQ